MYYLVRPPKTALPDPPLLVLLHGVGSNEQSMFSFADALPGKYLVVSLRGPLTLGLNRFAWFNVDFSTGSPVINPEQAENARKYIIRCLDELSKEQRFDKRQIYLLGFSQGGIMSYSVALTEPEKIAGIAVMSGRLLPEVKPLVAAGERLSKLRVFVSHGLRDNVLKYNYSSDAIDYLKTIGVQPAAHTFDAGHEIDPDMLHSVSAWLENA